MASLALAMIWGMVTARRVPFAALEKIVPGTTRSPYPALRADSIADSRVGGEKQAGARCFGLRHSWASVVQHHCRWRSVLARGNRQLSSHPWPTGLMGFYDIGYGISTFGYKHGHS